MCAIMKTVTMNDKTVTVIGAGLAGSEAAWQLAKAGIPVRLYEMKPKKRTPAHHSDTFAELVCSNSLRAAGLTNAVGLLKEEMRRLGSLIMEAADATRVPAGGALAVDRTRFSAYVTEKIKEHPLIEVIEEEVVALDKDALTVIASGPLTSDALAETLQKELSATPLSFYDAAAPIVTLDSLDMDIIYRAARWGKGGDDYLNCPMSREEYLAFYEALKTAEAAEVKGFEHNVFEGCMPIEEMAYRGEDTMRFGPLKPVGLPDPRTGRDPYAVVQLRQDNKEGTLFNLVGFQTHLKFPEQKRVFSMIPGLGDAEFVRYGVMHRNTFLNSPTLLNEHYQLKSNPNWFFAGQMTGVEGYVESASSGLVAGLGMAALVKGKAFWDFPRETATGALAKYISDPSVKAFQPMNVNFGLLSPLNERIRKKQEKNEKLAERALLALEKVLKENV